MKSPITNSSKLRFFARIDRVLAAGAATAAAATGAGLVGTTDHADGAIVYSGAVNINIPTTTSGVYLNVATGATGATGSTTPGWDVNPWGATSLNMFSPTPNPGGGPHVGTLSTYFNLTQGTMIDAASTYGNAGTTTINAGTPLNLNSSDNLVGFRFINEANGNAIHYGWMRIALDATAQAQPRSIVEYAWDDNAGTGIGAGVVPEPSSLGLLGLGAMGLLARRRRS